jgi:hypothetical protein
MPSSKEQIPSPPNVGTLGRTRFPVAEDGTRGLGKRRRPMPLDKTSQCARHELRAQGRIVREADNRGSIGRHHFIIVGQGRHEQAAITIDDDLSDSSDVRGDDRQACGDGLKTTFGIPSKAAV